MQSGDAMRPALHRFIARSLSLPAADGLEVVANACGYRICRIVNSLLIGLASARGRRPRAPQLSTVAARAVATSMWEADRPNTTFGFSGQFSTPRSSKEERPMSKEIHPRSGQLGSIWA